MIAILIIVSVVAAISLYDFFSTRSWQQITSTVRNETVFEKRNQKYGAYTIRRDYNRNLILILLGMVGGVGAIYGAASTFREPFKVEKKAPVIQDTMILVLNDDKEKIEEPKIDLPKKQVAVPPQAMTGFPEPKPSDERRDEKPPIVDSSTVVGPVTVLGPKNPWGPTGPPQIPIPGGDDDGDEKDKAPVKAGLLTEQAEYIGGEKERIKFMLDNLKFPEDAIRNETFGRCYLKFVVSKTGEIRDVQVVKGVPACASCDKEAKRVVNKMPAWKPGKINGRAVDSYFNLPITFAEPKG